MREILAILLLLGTPAWAGHQPDAPDAAAFLAATDARSSAQPTRKAPPLHAGQTTYLPLASLIRGQDEISVDNVLAKLQERISANDVHWDSAKDEWAPAFDHGRSPVPLDDPISIVLGPQGPVIIDGHHDTYLALYLGAESIPVHVVEDLSHLSPTEFWAEAQARELVLLPREPASLAESPPGLRGVRDNPNRYLASLLALKATVRIADDGTVEILKTKGAPSGVWLKINDSVPFIEFYLAKALTAAGVRYDPKWGKKVPPDAIEQARRALLRAQADGQTPGLDRIPLLESADVAARAAGDKAFPAGIVAKSVGYGSALCGSVFAD